MSSSNLEANGYVQPSSKSITRGKTDPVWGYYTERIATLKNKNAKVITCIYCEKSFQGGGIN